MIITEPSQWRSHRGTTYLTPPIPHSFSKPGNALSDFVSLDPNEFVMVVHVDLTMRKRRRCVTYEISYAATHLTRIPKV